MLVTLEKEDERFIRQFAQRKYGGKKGSIREAWHAAIGALKQKEKSDVERQKAVERVLADMREGLHFDLKGGKAYEKRDDIYADYFRKKGLY